MAAQNDFIKVFKENDFLEKNLKDKKILLVGAGGIGCEVLKNLVLSNFKYIHLIDLDTIEVSNLNRQFLFQREHVGKPKALVAKESALRFAPEGVEIIAHHGSIFDKQFGVNYFEQFQLVINALDNLKARSHVNRMCLAASVPLIETGSAGYLGQVEFIKGKVTQCYDCQQKPKQKSFPGCTIRNTPSEPIHCIVWAKHLFNQLFGEYDHEDEVSPDAADPESKKDSEESTGESAAKKIRIDNGEKKKVGASQSPINTREWAEKKIQYNPKKLFRKFFIDDIKYLLSMENLWKERTPPIPMNSINVENLLKKEIPSLSGTDRTLKIWSPFMCTLVFVQSCIELSKRLKELQLQKTNDDGKKEYLIWDKDDDVALDFVTACSNIRSYIFKISPKSRFDVKALAGNIIPAISTTNSMVAGLAVLYAINTLVGDWEKNRTIYVRQVPNARGHVFPRDVSLIPPNPSCMVCANSPQVTLELDLNKIRVRDLEALILKGYFNMIAPDVTLGENIILSSEEGETEQNMDKTLSEIAVTDGCVISCDDFLQEYSINITVRHKERETGKEGREEQPLFKVSNKGGELKPKEAKNQTETKNDSNEAKVEEDKKKVDQKEEDDDCVLYDEELDSTNGYSKQNDAQSTAQDESEIASKKRKVADEIEEDDCIIID